MHLQLDILVVAAILAIFSLWTYYRMRKLETDMAARRILENHLRKAYSDIEGQVQERTDKLIVIAKDLDESEKRYRGLYDSIREGIFKTDMDGNILECNPAYLAMLGYTIEEVLKLKYRQITPEKWHALDASILTEQVLKQGYSDEYEKENIRKDGAAFPVSVRVWLIKDENGNPTGMWRIVRDTTETKQANQQIISYRRQLEFEAAMNDLLEQQKQQIGQDLHDGLGQVLAALAMKGQWLANRLKPTLTEESAVAAAVVQMANQATAQVRETSQMLFPMELKKRGLFEALRELATYAEAHLGVTCRLVGEPVSTRPIDMVVAINLYRITQEAVTNAVRHGQAHQIEIQLTTTPYGELTVSDDGRGIEENPVGSERGMGLETMRSRARRINGALDVRARPEGGTLVTCTFNPEYRPKPVEGTA